MSAHEPEIVVVRRRSSLEDEHHGGAWKIAFADFMTAMMAFFLVLWIISATDKNTKTLIARYFNPVKVEEPAKAQKGIRGDGAPQPESGAPNRNSGDQALPAQAEKSAGPIPETASNEPGGKHEAKPEAAARPDPSRPSPTMSEEELFSDPRASLDKIAGAPAPGPLNEPSAAKGSGDVAPNADDAYRDPFRPLGSDKAISASADPGAAGAAHGEQTAKQDLQKEDSAQRGAAQQGATKQNAAAQESAKPGPAPTEATAEAAPPANVGGPRLDASPAHAARLLADIKSRLGPEAQLASGPQLDVEATGEGILVSLTDRENFSMFAIGSAEPQPRVVRMMDAIAMSLVALPGAIVVRGYTDAHPYRTPRYDNWRLSSARAQMAYYMLNRAGIAEKRFERIEGFADHRLKDPAQPYAAENRRIEILVREVKP